MTASERGRIRSSFNQKQQQNHHNINKNKIIFKIYCDEIKTKLQFKQFQIFKPLSAFVYNVIFFSYIFVKTKKETSSGATKFNVI